MKGQFISLLNYLIITIQYVKRGDVIKGKKKVTIDDLIEYHKELEERAKFKIPNANFFNKVNPLIKLAQEFVDEKHGESVSVNYLWSDAQIVMDITYASFNEQQMIGWRKLMEATDTLEIHDCEDCTRVILGLRNVFDM